MANEPEYGESYVPDHDGDEGSVGLPAQLRDLGGIFKRQIKWILSSFVLCLIATAIATSVFPLQYETRATILLSSKSIPDEFVPTTIISNILEQFEAIRGEVFSRAGLSQIITETGVYSDEWDVVPLTALASRLGEELVVRSISRDRSSRKTPSSIAFEVTMKGKDPEMLARVVNTTVAALINENLEYRSRQARVTTKFMQREFDRADEELRVHQRKLAQFRARSRGALPEEQEATISKLERLEDQRRSAILRIGDYQMRLERVQARPVTQDEAQGDLRQRLEYARTIYTNDHPTVLSLERQLRLVEERERPAGSSTNVEDVDEKAVVTRGIGLEQARLAEIDAAVSDLESRLAVAPEIAEDYSALVREEQILQESYVEYLRKLKNAELALSLESAQQGAQLTRHDDALVPTSPVIPRWMVALAGLAISLGLAPLIGVGREFIAPVFVDEQHLEDVTPIPCLGSISDLS